MDRTGDIRLDPDVLGFDMEAGVDSQLPLSDLYELPVFAKETKQKAGKYQREEKQMMERVRQGVFKTDGRKPKEQFERIQERIFQEVSHLSSSGFSESTFSLEELEKETENFWDVWIFLGIIMIGMLCIFPKKYCWRRKGADKAGNACLKHRKGGVEK